jgi:acetyl-CoA acetyltransferase
MEEHFEDRAVISGIGISEIGRRLQVDPWALTAQAALAAIADAGLSPDDIDGVSTYPGGAYPSPGLSGAGLWDVRRMLGLGLRWLSGGSEVAGQIGSVINAAVAVSSGIADHVLCFRTVWESTNQMEGGRAAAVMRTAGDNPDDRAEGDREFSVPFGAGHACHGGLLAQRYFHDYGARREQLAQIALTARTNAGLNPGAVYREPLTLEDYLGARMISDPLCLYDCDPPVDGAVAVIVSRRQAAPDTGRPPIQVEAVGSIPGLDESGRMLWERSLRFSQGDVDIAQLYDGWSILSLLWLEALGLCGRGEAAKFVEGGSRIALDGELPLNTGGGQLSGGRLHGYSQLFEACLQLRGEAGGRQVRPLPEVAAVSTGAGHFSGCMLLSNQLIKGGAR